MVWPIDDLTHLAEIITDVAFADPLSFALVALGTVLMGGSILAFAGLSTAGCISPLFTD